MKLHRAFNLSDVDTMMKLIDAIFSEMNIGLVVFQLEQEGKSNSLKLVYANRQASEYSNADVSQHIGKYIHEAFPPLAETDIPDLYAEVIRTGQPRNIGAFEYKDAKAVQGYYAIKAFPMPNDCVGVLFENITLRKQLEEMLKSQTSQANDRKVAG